MSAWHGPVQRETARLNILRMRARLDQSAHTHIKPVAGCYRCELNETEAQEGKP